MKKLMFAAATAAIATGAFADRPAVYDYKATVKHMYLKEVNVTTLDAGVRQTVKVYQKYQKSANLKGYLIHDVNGATSFAAHRNLAGTGNFADPAAGTLIAGLGTPIAARAANNFVGQGPQQILIRRTFDKVNNRAFLVVQNASAEANVRMPKILPAVLEAKFFDSKFTVTTSGPTYTSGIAEGSLFVGGDLDLGVKNYLRNDRVDDAAAPINPSVAVDATGANVTAAGSYLDYGWTSVYLFGKYNGPNGANFGAPVNWDAAQAAISAVQIIPDVGGINAFYHDTWMNGVGVGKYGVIDDSEQCCGFQVGGVNFGLDSLAGKLKGGLFLCSENGYRADSYQKLGGVDWEDQFWNEKAYRRNNATPPVAYANPAGLTRPAYINAGAGDVDQEDVWIDGDIEQFTTDVLDGDWSIKFVSSAKAPYDALLDAELRAISGLRAAAAGEAIVSTLNSAKIGNTDLDDLNATIKGCAKALNSRVEYVRTSGTARTIPTIAAQRNNSRFTVPFIDTNFARAYGLASYMIITL